MLRMVVLISKIKMIELIRGHIMGDGAYWAKYRICEDTKMKGTLTLNVRHNHRARDQMHHALTTGN